MQHLAIVVLPQTEIDSRPFHRSLISIIPIHLLSSAQIPHIKIASVTMLPVLRSRQFNVSPGPKVTQVTDREVQSDSHLTSHDDETHVPSKKSHDEQ